MKAEILVKVGLTRQEANVYLTLLRIGPTTAGRITSGSGIHRRSVYDCIDRLIQKGLVSYYTIQKKRVFEAAHPERLLQVIKEREQRLREGYNGINEIMPELITNYKISAFKHEASVFRGKEGLKTILEDILATGQENLVLGAEDTAPRILPHYITIFHKTRIAKKLRERLIFISSCSERAEKMAKLPYTKVKILPKPYNPSVTFNIYENKTAILTWLENEPIGILIENEHIARGMRQYFEMMWKECKSR
jgi:HTH-type transcriptional regulator, sugar sensing transcriptional regulator